jgi:hypothetical protein
MKLSCSFAIESTLTPFRVSMQLSYAALRTCALMVITLGNQADINQFFSLTKNCNRKIT